jgi:serine phosphatase RsbU (regulator of sigma subunit)
MLRLNARVHDVVPTNMFVTLCCGLLGTDSVSWINAGHEPLFLWDAEHDRVRALLTEDATPLGILDEFHGRKASTGFGLGDVLLLVTDGVTESPRFIGDAYPRLSRVLASLGRRGADAAEVVDDVYREAVNDPNERPADDIAIFSARRIR